METKHSPWSKKHFKPKKGVVNIPNCIRTVISTEWTEEIAKLEKFFAGIVLPTNPLKLNSWTIVTDPASFIESELAFVKTTNGIRIYRPHIDRLIELRRKLLRYRKGEARKEAMLLRKTRLKDKRQMRISLRTIPDDDFVLEMASKFTAKEQRLVNKNASPQKHFLLTSQH